MKKEVVKIKRLTDFKISRGQQPLVLDFTKIEFKFNLAKPELMEKIDGLISEGRDFTLLNLPLCFVLGYKRYCRFRQSSAISRVAKCRGCCYASLCGGVGQDYIKAFGDAEIIQPGQNQSLMDLERCLLKILSLENNIPSQRVLALSKKINLCSTCDDGAIILTVGERMIRQGLVKKTLKKGQYYWGIEKKNNGTK